MYSEQEDGWDPRVGLRAAGWVQGESPGSGPGDEVT